MVQEGFKRKLTAILNADVEGYSRHMGEDEESDYPNFNRLPRGNGCAYTAV